jgi:nucleoside-diphosphate-sugar epimerase
VAYVGEGQTGLAAAHVTDTVRLFRLALEQGRPGARYNAVAEEGVPLRDICEAIGAGLKLPVQSITPDKAKAYFGFFADLAQTDLSASSALTRKALGWVHTGPDLLSDLREMEYGA